MKTPPSSTDSAPAPAPAPARARAVTVTVVVHNWTSSQITLTPPSSQPTSVDAKSFTRLSVAASADQDELVTQTDRANLVTVQTTNGEHILLLPKRDTRTWLSCLPGNVSLAALCIPGTHESAALFGWPISTCQSSSSSIASQLERGIRYLDIRLSVKGQAGHTRLLAYHGITDQRTDFEAILQQTYAFLAAHPSETVIMSVKQENDLPNFKELVLERHVYPNKSRWFLDPRVPTLKECRGKIVMLSRFGRSTEQPGGIHPPIWPNSRRELFHYTLPSGQHVETQDWYDIRSLANLDAKLGLIQALCNSSGRDPSTLGLNCCNASSFPLALPPFVAQGFRQDAQFVQCASVRGLNSRLLDFVVSRITATAAEKENRGLMAIFALDYFETPEQLVPVLIEANF